MRRPFRVMPALLAAASLFLALSVSACSGSPEAHIKKGDEYFGQKNYKAALVEYRNAARKDPKSGVARQKLARTYRALDGMDSAWREFVRAADLMPDDVGAQLDAAESLLGTGQFDDAKGRTERIIAKDPTNVRAHLIRGLATAGVKDYDSAIKDIQKALELDPKRATSYANLGALELARGRSEEAEAALKQAATLAPNAFEPQLALANFYWSVGRRGDAETALKTAVTRKPDSVDANAALAIFYIVSGRPEEAETPLKAAAAHDDAIEAQLMLADYYAGRSRTKDALPILNKLATRKEAAAAAGARLAGIDYIEGRRDAAYAKLDELLKTPPPNVQILVLKTRWLLDEKRLDEALKTAKAGVAADPKSPSAYYWLGGVYSVRQEIPAAIEAFNQVLQLNPRAAPAQVELARLKTATGKPTEAVQLASDVIKANPGNLDARLALVQGLRRKGEYSRAATELASLLDAAPRSAVVHVEAGEIALRQKDYRKAAASFDEALKLDPASYDGLAGRVSVDYLQHKYADVTARLDKQLERTPKDVRVLALAGRMFAAMGDLARAEKTLQRAIDVDATYMPSFHYLGQLYVRQKRLDESRQRYEAMLKQHPDNIGVRSMVAMLLQAQNHDAEAKDQYERILQIDPRAVVAANNLAYMNAEAGTDLNRALELARTAKAALPDEPDVNDTLGWVYYKKDMAALAIDPLKQSVERVPGNPIYRYHLGMAYLKSGDKDKAREMLQQALKLDPKFAGAEDARRALDGLGS